MNNKPRTIFIWDIHWCYDELKLLLKKINIQKEDRVFFVWDMINKGPKSYKVIKFLYKNRNQYKAIKWNHEVWFLNWIDSNSPKTKNTIYKKLKHRFTLKPKKLEYIRNLPLYIEEDNFILLHWWLIPNKKIEDHTEDEITKLREVNGELWYNLYKWDKKIIYGHNALDWLQIREKTIWLDSWCVYWKALSAYVLETWEIYTQNALSEYVNLYKNKVSFRTLIKQIFIK